MSKGSSILLAIVMAIGGFMVGNVVGYRFGTEGSSEAGSAEEAAADVAVAGDVERFKIPVTSVTLISEPFAFRSPIDVLLRLPNIFTSTCKAECFESHRFISHISCKDE